MINDTGPCQLSLAVVHVIIIALQVVQAIAVAYVSRRAVRKNREDKARRADISED